MFICVTIIRYVESHAFTAQYHINYYRSTNKRCYGPERQQPALAGQLADYIAKKCYGSTGNHCTGQQEPVVVAFKEKTCNMRYSKPYKCYRAAERSDNSRQHSCNSKDCRACTGKSTKQKRCVAGKPHFTHSQKPIREQHNHSNAKPCTFFSLLFFVKSSETKRYFHQ